MVGLEKEFNYGDQNAFQLEIRERGYRFKRTTMIELI
jgi:hypothetical protein